MPVHTHPASPGSRQMQVRAYPLGGTGNHWREVLDPVQVDLERMIEIVGQGVANAIDQRLASMNASGINEQKSTRLGLVTPDTGSKPPCHTVDRSGFVA